MPILFIFLFSISFAKEKPLEIISYNVQNLFDAEHDDGNEDFEFLPLNHHLKAKGCKKKTNCRKRNWDSKSINLKISQIKKALGFPDILCILEIENEKIAKQLATRLGYSNFLVSKTNDKRGIRTALFFKQGTILRRKEISIEGSRSIFEIRLDFFGGNPITFFINHWPSQMQASYRREMVAKKLIKRINQLEGENIIIVGDFNLDPRYEGNSLFEEKKLIDLSPIYEKNPGSYYYIPEKKWWGFDRVLITQGLLKSVKDVKILRKKEISRDFISDGKIERIPFRYNYSTQDPLYAGFSDHFPIRLRLVPIN